MGRVIPGPPRNSVAVAPAHRCWRGLSSLLEILERFDAHVFFELSALLTHVQQPEIDALDWGSRYNWVGILEPYESVCERLEFKASRAAIHELLQMLGDSGVSSG